MVTARVISIALVAAVTFAGCGASQSGRAAAELKVVCVPETASVYVDERFLASARKLARTPARLRTGRHFVTVSAPDYFPHDVEVDLPEGLTTVEIRLRPVPP